MLIDTEENREVAITKITNIRKYATEPLRKFKVPKFNLNANSFNKMIDWNKCDITEPPLTKGLI